MARCLVSFSEATVARIVSLRSGDEIGASLLVARKTALRS